MHNLARVQVGDACGDVGDQFELAFDREICPLFVLMRSFFLNLDKSISWSFAFSVHALLTALVETDSVVNDVMAVSRKNFQNFFKIVDWANRF